MRSHENSSGLIISTKFCFPLSCRNKIFRLRVSHLIVVLVSPDVLAIPKAQKWVFMSYTENFLVSSRLVFTLKVGEGESVLTPYSNKIWKLHCNFVLPDSRVSNQVIEEMVANLQFSTISLVWAVCQNTL